LPERSDALFLPRWRLTRWLVHAGQDVPAAIRGELIHGLYGTLPIFAGGVINTVAVSTVIAIRIPQPLFIAWAAAEIALMLMRLPVLLWGRRAIAEGREPPTDLYMLLGVLWAAMVGFGAFISLTSGDWVAATLACLSSAAMVGGICFRNFGAPRLVAVMILLSLGPYAVGGALSGEPLLLLAALQIPLYLFSMTAAAFKLNRMLVSTMRAERENDHRARHDGLTGLLNRAGLEHAIQPMLRDHEGHGSLTLFFLDLDGFKSVNDNHGHAAGDQLLRIVGERLSGILEPEDAVARLGGDEFVAVLKLADRNAAELARAIVSSLGESWYDLDVGVAAVGVSIGVAHSPDHGRDLASLLAAADAALYHAKASGRSRYVMASQPLRLVRRGGASFVDEARKVSLTS
jgi:diguanylate cyclase